MPALTRTDLINTLHASLWAQPFVQAAWIGGSAAFDRVDDLSDVDGVVIVDDDRVAETFAIVESALDGLSPISWRFVMPMPTWHGHAQRFYHQQDAPEHLFVDLVVMQRSQPGHFLEPLRHGRAQILFDRAGIATPQAIDPDAWQQRLRDRLATLRGLHPLYQSLVVKAIARGDLIEALVTYQQRSFLPLVELLRITHDPYRYDFGVRYLKYDLPAEVVARLERLAGATTLDQVAQLHTEASAWSLELLTDLDAQPDLLAP